MNAEITVQSQNIVSNGKVTEISPEIDEKQEHLKLLFQ